MSRYSKKNLISALTTRALKFSEVNDFRPIQDIGDLTAVSVETFVDYGKWEVCNALVKSLNAAPAPSKEKVIEQLELRATSLGCSFGLSTQHGTAQLNGKLAEPATMAAYGDMRLCMDLADGIRDGSFLRQWCKVD